MDYKTYRQAPSRMKDWRQAAIYHVAFRDLLDRGVLNLDPSLPFLIVFDYVRLGERRDYALGEADESQLFTELELYRRGVDAGVFLPASKSTNPDFCDYDNCCLKQRGEGVGLPGGFYAADAA